MVQGWGLSEGGGRRSRPVLAGPHAGSYLALPAVNLEALKAEFQDDSPASGTILGGRELVGAGHYLPGPALPQDQAHQATPSTPPPLPRDWALESGLPRSCGGVDGAWQIAPPQPGS